MSVDGRLNDASSRVEEVQELSLAAVQVVADYGQFLALVEGLQEEAVDFPVKFPDA